MPFRYLNIRGLIENSWNYDFLTYCALIKLQLVNMLWEESEYGTKHICSYLIEKPPASSLSSPFYPRNLLTTVVYFYIRYRRKLNLPKLARIINCKYVVDRGIEL